MIKPEGIPVFLGDLTRVSLAANDLSSVGNEIVGIAQGMEKTYRDGMDGLWPDGPERHLLLASMKPVKDEGEKFGPELGKVARALHEFVGEVQGHVRDLGNVKSRGHAFITKVGGRSQDDIDDDKGLVEEENKLHKDLQGAMDGIQAAERRCANKIAALYGGRKWDEKSGHRDGDPPPPQQQEEKEPPWGTPLEYDAPWYEDALDFVGGVLKGIFVDGILGTLDALTTLIPIQPLLKSMGVNSIFGHELKGWKECGQAWVGVGLTMASVAMYTIPGAAALMHVAFPETAKYLDNVGLTVLKGMVAWDTWGEDPGRALGQVGFNVITTIGTGGAGGAVRGAAIAGKYGSVAAKVATGAEVAMNIAGKLRPGQLAINTALKLPKVSDLVIKIGDSPTLGGLAKLGGLDIPTSKATPNLPGGIDSPNVSTGDRTPATVGGGDSTSVGRGSDGTSTSPGHDSGSSQPGNTDSPSTPSNSGSGDSSSSSGQDSGSSSSPGDGDSSSSSQGDGSSTSHGDGDSASTSHGDGDGSSTSHGDGDGASTSHGDGDSSSTSHGDGDGATTSHGDGDGATTSHSDRDTSTTSHGDGDSSSTSHGDGDGTSRSHGDRDTSTTSHGDRDTSTASHGDRDTSTASHRDGDTGGTTHREADSTTTSRTGSDGHGQPRTEHSPTSHGDHSRTHTESTRTHTESTSTHGESGRTHTESGRTHTESGRTHTEPTRVDPVRAADGGPTRTADVPPVGRGTDTPPIAPPMHTHTPHSPSTHGDGHPAGRSGTDSPTRPTSRTDADPQTGHGRDSHDTTPGHGRRQDDGFTDVDREKLRTRTSDMPPGQHIGHKGQDRHYVEPWRYDPIDSTGRLTDNMKKAVANDPVKNADNWVKHGNPHYLKDPRGRAACGDNARAFLDNLQGREPRLANIDLRVPPTGERREMYEWAGIQPNRMAVPGSRNADEYTRGGMDAIRRGLEGKPPGTGAVIFGGWHKPPLPNGMPQPRSGHWFNAYVDHKGRVRWADMQSGETGPWPPHYNGNKFDDLDVMVREPGGDFTSPFAPSRVIDANHPFDPPPTPNPSQPGQPGQPHQQTPQQTATPDATDAARRTGPDPDVRARQDAQREGVAPEPGEINRRLDPDAELRARQDAQREGVTPEPGEVNRRMDPDGTTTKPESEGPSRIERALDPNADLRARQDAQREGVTPEPGEVNRRMDPDGTTTKPESEGPSPIQQRMDPDGSSGTAEGEGQGFGRVDEPDFDPAFEQGALGERFGPEVHDPHNSFQEKERAIADRLQEEGWRVDGRPEDHTVQHKKNPEAMVRKDPVDEGSITEFKTLKSGSASAAKRNINDASDQVPPDGDVVIDGRNVGLTEEAAEQAFRKALGQPGKTVAARVHMILGDGRFVTYVKES